MNAVRALALCAAVAASTMGDSCSGTPTSEDVQNAKQEQMNRQAVQEVGMPAIRRFSEKRQLKRIYELRDEAITTTTYIVDLYGNLHKICESIGYGIPYATEYTNPQQSVGSSERALTTIAQADPNGLYSPAGAEGTWVQCLDPHTKQSVPLYVEPRVIVSPYALK